MNPFAIYLLKRMPLPDLLREHSELLDPEAINRLFRQQAEEMLPRVQDPAVREDLVGFLRMNVVAYIDKAFRRAGIRDPDLDEAIQTIVVKFLVTPGNLFRGWKPDQLFTPRFKTAVKNSVITLGQRTKKQAKRFQELPQEPPATKAVAVEDDPIQDFRHFVELRYGPAVLRVLDHRLADKTNTKDLVGQPGLESSYSVKRAVQQIKAAAVRWSQSHPDFLLRIHRLMDQEKATLAKRFAAKELAGMT